MTVLNLRGPSGSGKSSAVYAILQKFHGVPDLGVDGRIQGYVCDNGLYVVGKYLAHGSGGFDMFRGTFPEGNEFVFQIACKYPSVLLEGMIASGATKRWLELEDRLAGVQKWCYAFLDTPYEECVRRVYTRNGGKPIKEAGLLDHSNRRFRQIRKLTEMGRWVEIIPHQDPVSALLKLLGENQATNNICALRTYD